MRELSERLQFRSSPLHSESILGYLLRLASANGIHGIRPILKSVQLSTGLQFLPQPLEALATLCGTSAAQLIGATYRKSKRSECADSGWWRGISPNLTTKGRPRICPLCIKVENKLDRLWEMNAYTVCHKHFVLLVDRCPYCNRSISWSREHLARCRCGLEFSSIPRTRKEKPEEYPLRVSSFIALQAGFTVSPMPEMPSVMSGVSVQDMLKLTRFFGMPSVQQGLWRSQYISNPDQTQAVNMVRTAGEILFSWPDGFENWVHRQRIITPDAQKTIDGKSIYGNVLDRLRHVFEHNRRTHFIIEETRKILSREALSTTVRASNFFYQKEGVPSLISAAEAAARLHVTNSTIFENIARGRIRGRIVSVNGRRMGFVEVESVEEYRSYRKSLITPVETATLLGISAKQVCRLLLGNQIRAEKECGVWKVQQADFDGFQEALKAKLGALCCKGAEDLLPLGLLPEIRTRRMTSVLGDVLSRKIEAYHIVPIRSGLFWEIGIARKEIYGSRDFGAGETGVSVAVAGQMLGVSSRQITELKRRGLIGTVAGSELGKNRILVSSIRDFGKLYAFSRSACDELGILSRTLFERASRANISPVIQPDVRRGISAVWRAQDLSRLYRLLSAEQRAPRACSNSNLSQT